MTADDAMCVRQTDAGPLKFIGTVEAVKQAE